MNQNYNFKESDINIISSYGNFNYYSFDANYSDINIKSISKPDISEYFYEITVKSGIGDSQFTPILPDEEIKIKEEDVINIPRTFDSINKDFYIQEKWIEEQRLIYPNEILAFIKINEKLELIAHDRTESEVLKQIDKLFEKKILNKDQTISFDR